MQDITGIQGDLIVNGDGLNELDLSDVLTVGGDVVIEDSQQLSILRFGGLSEVFGSVMLLRLDNLETLSLKALEIVGDHFQVIGNSKLEKIDISHLFSVDGNFNLEQDTVLEKVDMSNIGTIGGEIVVRDTGLHDLSFPALSTKVGHTYFTSSLIPILID